MANGYKTYLAAIGLFGLALYQLTTEQYDQAIHSAAMALAAIGIRHAIGRGQEDNERLHWPWRPDPGRLPGKPLDRGQSDDRY